MESASTSGQRAKRSEWRRRLAEKKDRLADERKRSDSKGVRGVGGVGGGALTKTKQDEALKDEIT